MKRIDGLEKRLVSEGKNESAIEDDPSPGQETPTDSASTATVASRPRIDIAPNAANPAAQLMSPIEPR